MKHSESIKNIAPAIRRAQKEIGVVVANADNSFFKSKYADLDACWKVVKEPLQKEGIAVLQTMGFIPGAGPTLITTLLHDSGEYISGEQPVCAKTDDPQGMGSAITYARRYGLSAITGLIQVDDDGEGAMGRKPQQGESPPSDSGSANVRVMPGVGDYVFKFGKYKGKRLSEIGAHDLNGYCQWLKGNHKPGDDDSAIRAMEAYLQTRSFERSK